MARPGRCGVVLSAGLLAVAPALGAQASPDRCIFRIGHVDRTGAQIVIAPGLMNYYAGGNVFLYCEGTRISMRSDSVASYGATRSVDFVGHVVYTDSGSIVMRADHGTYYRDGDRWEARGHVTTDNLKTGSTMTGPSLDYYRQARGVRDTAEMYAVARPTIRYMAQDTTGKTPEPYVIVADRVRMKGDDRVWAAGKVTIDRSDFAARADSLRLDTGAGSDGTLIGNPMLRGVGKDSFNLTGHRIDLRFDRRELDYVTALGDGHAVSAAIDLRADTVGLDIDKAKLVQTVAWGDSLKPDAVSADYRLRGDSMAFDTPADQLTETRAFGKAWAGAKADSGSGDRDWLAGDTLVAHFARYDSVGVARTVVHELEARANARSYYRLVDASRPGPPSISYVRGNQIVIRMKEDGSGVERVDVRGRVEGVQLDPAREKHDSTATDSTAVPVGQ
jgi:hypothetical protein